VWLSPGEWPQHSRLGAVAMASITDVYERFQAAFKRSPELREEQQTEGGARFRFTCVHPEWEDLSALGEWSANKRDARRSAVEHALASWPFDQSAAPAAQEEADRAARKAEEERLAKAAEEVAPDPRGSAQPSQCQFDMVYSAEREIKVASELAVEVDDMLAAFEQAPLARDVVHVQEILRIRQNSECHRDLREQWRLQVKRLQVRAEDANFPKPHWWQLGKTRTEQREREEVWWHLHSTSRRHPDAPKVRTARIFHGCKEESVAESIFALGFAGNVQNTKGWFGEGIYATTSATYALRYGLDMTDFWENPGKNAVVIVGQVAFSQVYPVTRADNDSPLESVTLNCEDTPLPRDPGLKGKRIASAPGAKGCDAHFVCVRRHPPFGSHRNATYHACAEGERPDGTELVVNQEAQYLPEYLVRVRICDDPELCAAVGKAALSWGRRLQPTEEAASAASAASAEAAPAAPAGAAPAAPAADADSVGSSEASIGAPYMQELHALVTKHWKSVCNTLPLVYTEEKRPDGDFLATVQVKLNREEGPGEVRLFTGEPQPRMKAARQSAAKVALNVLKPVA